MWASRWRLAGQQPGCGSPVRGSFSWSWPNESVAAALRGLDVRITQPLAPVDGIRCDPFFERRPLCLRGRNAIGLAHVEPDAGGGVADALPRLGDLRRATGLKVTRAVEPELALRDVVRMVRAIAVQFPTAGTRLRRSPRSGGIPRPRQKSHSMLAPYRPSRSPGHTGSGPHANKPGRARKPGRHDMLLFDPGATSGSCRGSEPQPLGSIRPPLSPVGMNAHPR